MDLESTAERYDAVYTALTGIQKRLIDARRNGLDAKTERELINEASSLSAAVQVALRSTGFGLSVADAEAAALAARILQPPVDGIALVAALRSMVRRQAFPFLSAALRMSGSDMPASLGKRRLFDLLAAPKAMGDQTARALCRHSGFDPDVALDELAPTDLDVLCGCIDDAVDQLPLEVRRTRGRRPAAPPDGSGAAKTVLDLWVDSTGPPLEGTRAHVAAAARHGAWSDDAVPVAQLLADFTLRCIAPVLLEEWGELNQIEDQHDRSRAMERQGMSWFHRQNEELEMKAAILCDIRVVMDSQIGLNAMDGNYSKRYRSSTAMSLARRIAKASGELLTCLERQGLEEVLVELKADPT